MSQVDAIVVGSGPNGLAAAVVLARSGLAVRVYERASSIGGGTRTEQLTLPGFLHDVGSAVHPQALSSAFFRAFELERRVSFVVPEISYAHPLENGRSGIAWLDIDRTADDLGVDGRAWKRLLGPLVQHAGEVAQFAGSSLLQLPRHPLTLARVGVRVLEQGGAGWNLRFREEVAPALLTGVTAHVVGRLPALASAAAGLVLATAGHARGWPIPIGGSRSIAQAMADDLLAHGGEIVTDTEISSIQQLPPAKVLLFDVSPRALARIAGDRMPERYRRSLERFRYGNAVAKVDFALSDPVPWSDERLQGAATLHLGGTRAQIRLAEESVAAGREPEHPYVLASQPTRFDPNRAPGGKHVLWAYTHVPRGSGQDRTEAITAAIERHAPGFRDTILASASRTAIEVESDNPNYIGGDISAGAVTIAQLLARPVLSRTPWRTAARGIYLCSSATPPGPAVHGLAGYYAAMTALRDEFGVTEQPYLGVGLSA